MSELKIYIKEKSEQPNPKQVFPKCDSIINYAFTIEDKDFFEFEDFSNTKVERAFQVLTFQNEMLSCVSRDYLNYFSEALINTINNPAGIKITDIAKLALQLKERVNSLSEINIAYKLCSVVFFDSSENPDVADFFHSNKNAELFKKVDFSFFLNRRIKELIPISDLSTEGLRNSLQVMRMINKEHLENISTMLSEKTKNSESYKQFMLENNLV